MSRVKRDPVPSAPEQANVLRDTYRMHRVPGPCAMVIFGGLGDLAGRKLIPALYNLYLRRLLPSGFAVIGAGRRDVGGDDGYRAEMCRRCETFSRTPVTEPEWSGFAAFLHWVRGSFDDPDFYRALAQQLDELKSSAGTGGNTLYYLSVPPSQFPVVVDGLARQRSRTARAWRRAVIEKPFGRDLASSTALNRQVHRAFEESQVFRIDHYLGKETVQNILVFRFANGIFEPVWNRNFIDHIQITVAESIGVEGRGRFYEEAGALRDIVQNHMLQILSFVAMEPPASFAAEAVRDERGKALQAVRPLKPADAVRGQYAAGFVDGQRVVSYRQEQGVSPVSDVETFVAARIRIDNWRWADTPIYIRTGKRLPKRVTEIAIQFKRVPHLPFSYAAAEQLEPNVLVLRIQPNEGIALRFGAKVPSERIQIRTVNMDFEYATAFSAPPAEAYETLLIDAMRGDATNFPRQDAVEQSWRIVEPVLDEWAQLGGGPHLYEAGTWGPGAADELIASDRRRWRRP
jgi:glucose-6-phosphate 1-dehydrogenase